MGPGPIRDWFSTWWFYFMRVHYLISLTYGTLTNWKQRKQRRNLRLMKWIHFCAFFTNPLFSRDHKMRTPEQMSFHSSRISMKEHQMFFTLENLYFFNHSWRYIVWYSQNKTITTHTSLWIKMQNGPLHGPPHTCCHGFTHKNSVFYNLISEFKIVYYKC